MLTGDEARDRVARGAAHLDTVWPGWADQIDLGTLTLENPCRCIVGQLVRGTTFTNFSKAARRLFPQLDLQDGGWRWGIDVDAADVSPPGVSYATNEDFDSAFRLLQDAWLEAIADRRLQREHAGIINLAAARAPVSSSPDGDDRVKDLSLV